MSAHYSRRRRMFSRIIRACFRACFHACFHACFRAGFRAGFRTGVHAGICACFRTCFRAGLHAGFRAGFRAGFSRRVFTQGCHAGVHAHGGRVPGVLPPAAAVPSAAARVPPRAAAKTIPATATPLSSGAMLSTAAVMQGHASSNLISKTRAQIIKRHCAYPLCKQARPDNSTEI